MPETAMLLAAGRGTRMGALTTDRPKPLLTVGGRAIVDYAVDRLVAAGVRRIVVNLHHMGEMIRAHLSARRDAVFVFSDESDALLETGGGIARALPLLGTAPFFVVNGDALWLDADQAALARLAAAFDASAMDALLLVQTVGRAIGYAGAGDFHLEASGRLRRRGGDTPAPYVFTGVQVVAPSLFADHPGGAFSINLLYDRALAAGRLFGLPHAGAWMELNAPAGLAAAETALAG
jgi:MurNAc alpha-1-phosphate uridylyltransferase